MPSKRVVNGSAARRVITSETCICGGGGRGEAKGLEGM